MSIMPAHSAGTLAGGGEVIVVGLDDSAHAAEVLRFALHEADLRGTRLRALHVWSGAPIVPMSAPGMVPVIATDEMRDDAATRLQELVADVAGDRADRVERVLVAGPAGATILEHARDAELIVVGTHARGPVGELILGSVSHYVARHARCPVVVVPPVRA
jgi:nucleotide-binding universal stress UspA family protein